MISPRRRHFDSRGYSLLEVIIATAILAGSALVLHSLIANGVKASQSAQRETEALEIAQTVLDEIVATGAVESRDEETAVEGSPEWSYRLHIDRQEKELIAHINIEVFATPSRNAGRGDSRSSTRAICHLQRWVRTNLTAEETATQELPFGQTTGDVPP